MRVGVLGGTGFLGQYVIDCLRERKHDAIIVTRNKKMLDEKNTIVTEYSKDEMKKQFENLDAIIHLAAKRSSNNNISEFHDNEILTQNLYTICSELNIKNIVYASTISVYSVEKELPWDEEATIKPKLMYGISKFSCELIGEIYNEKNDLNIKNLRLAHLYGFNEKNNYMINKFMRQAYNKQKLELDKNSNAKREFLYVKDAAKAIVSAIENESVKGNYNIGSGEFLTNYEVAQKINKNFKNESEIFIKDKEHYDALKSSYMISTKAKEKIGFLCDYNLDQAMQEIYELMKGLSDVPILY